MRLSKSVCIETLYCEIPFLDRFQAAQNDGFESVEFWDWRDKDLAAVKAAAGKARINISGFNGDADYSLIDPAHKSQYLDFIQQSAAVAKMIGAASITIHSNALGDMGLVVNDYRDLSDTVRICSMYDKLRACAQIAEDCGITMNLEALNVTTDHVGNFLKTTQMGAEMCRLIGSQKLKILYDVYHMQLNEGSLCDNLSRYADQIGHIHVADAPGRHEPGTGEINYARIFAHLEAIGYNGRVGFELYPARSTAAAVQAIMIL